MKKIQRFKIEGLHGYINLDVPVQDNKLILVGENGVGKSTTINMLYYFLKRKFHKLNQYDFKKMSVTIDDEEYIVTKRNISPFMDLDIEYDDVAMRSPRARYYGRLKLAMEDVSLVKLLEDREYLNIFSEKCNVPQNYAFSYLKDLREIDEESFNYISDLTDRLKTAVNFEIIFQPTYRRIEENIKNLSPSLSRALVESNFFEKSGEASSIINLINFGMDDVDGLIVNTLNSLKENFSNKVSGLFSVYLKDVIRKDVYTGSRKIINSIPDEMLDEILSRIGSELISTNEQRLIRDTVRDLKEKKRLTKYDKMILNLVMRLVLIYIEQEDDEKALKSFLTTCNRYLTNKKIVFDKKQFTYSIETSHCFTPEIKTAESCYIDLDRLSSGEKQIVSLFAMMTLGVGKDYMVFIDEPELSLSVPWQKIFLVDVLKSAGCTGIVAVTHSPFIFDNELDDYTYSIESYMEIGG